MKANHADAVVPEVNEPPSASVPLIFVLVADDGLLPAQSYILL